MSKKNQIANSILWAAAILVAAILDAPRELIFLLPILAVSAVVLNRS